MRLSLFSISLLVLFSSSINAFRAVPNQQCAQACGDVTTTKKDEIVCSASELQNTPPGQALQNCLSCQANSTANDPNTGESDLRWFIYNVRYIMSSCLWGYPNFTSALSTPCTTSRACGPYQSNIEYDSLFSNASTFDYCSGFDSRVSVEQPQCTNCLQQLRDDFYISNFFLALVAGCQQRPNPGSLLSLQGNIFANIPVNITTPVPTSTPTGSAQPTNGLALGGMVGAAIGGVVLVLIIIGCCTVWWGKRRRRASLDRAEQRALRGSIPLGGHIEPRWGQGTPGGWEGTPTSAGGYGSDKQEFSPYMSQYTSPVSARDMLNPKQLWEAHEAKMGTLESAVRANEAIEMEKMRDARIDERRRQEAQMHDTFMQEAASRGFTTAPIIRAPSVIHHGHGLGLRGLEKGGV